MSCRSHSTWRLLQLSRFCSPRCPSRVYGLRTRSLHNASSFRSQHLLQNQISTTSVVAAVACVAIGSFVAYTVSPAQPKAIAPSVEAIPTYTEEVMALPGRPGNLTADQEAKLKEFWKAVFKVFGVKTTADAEDLEEEGEDEPEQSVNGTAPEKEKKKKRSLFSRKKKDKDKKDKKGDDITKISAGEDDKYGQTKEFLDAIANNTPEDLHKSFWANVKNENPDGLLLRFLRARKWDIEKALVMMVSTLQWRQKEMHVEEDIVFNGELAALKDSRSEDKAVKKEGEDFLTQLRKGMSYVHGVDKEGRPVTIVRVKLHHGGEQTEKSIERFTVHVFETTRLLLQPPADTGVCSFSPHRQNTRYTKKIF
jgi:hypothetical protein